MSLLFTPPPADGLAQRVAPVGQIPESEADFALRLLTVGLVACRADLRRRAAVEAREGIGVLNDGLFPEHGVFLELRTAISTGDVLVTPDAAELATGRAIAAAEELAQMARHQIL